ncbi:MAG: BtpA/SgcQ family protein [Oscillospiraceae bacterium]|nr:BtpA/SgcQ family protein [Oscillospiraceae bacterium]
MDEIAKCYAIAERIKYDVPDRPGKPEVLFEPRGVAAVVGLLALPGTSQNIYPMRRIIEVAVDEAKRYYAAGIRNILVQNVNDVPMKCNIGYETVASVTAAAYAVREALPDDCVMGVSVLRDNGKALVATANAVEADYIRPKCYVGTVVGMSGLHDGIMDDVLEMRYVLRCNTGIAADIHDRSTSPLGGVTLVDAVMQAVSQGLVDAVNIAGKSFDESMKMIDEVKKAAPSVYVNLGGGANAKNLDTVYKHADGIFVASCLKDTGNMTGKVDDEKVRIFMKAHSAVCKG